MVLSFKFSGTSLRTIRCANPSTIAVLPTPGSPIKTGLFLVFLDKIRITSRISSSRPMIGSCFPAFTCCVLSQHRIFLVLYIVLPGFEKSHDLLLSSLQYFFLTLFRNALLH